MILDNLSISSRDEVGDLIRLPIHFLAQAPIDVHLPGTNDMKAGAVWIVCRVLLNVTSPALPLLGDSSIQLKALAQLQT